MWGVCGVAARVQRHTRTHPPTCPPPSPGGYLAFLALEAVRGGRKVDPNLEKGVMASGFLLLLTAGAFLIVKDTLGLVAGALQ